MILNVYIAAAWDEKDYAKEVRAQLDKAGIGCTSSWLDFEGDEHDPVVLRREALNDWADVLKGNALVLLNTQKRGEETTGHAIETGIALQAQIPIYMLGEPTTVFHYIEQGWHGSNIRKTGGITRCTSIDNLIKRIFDDKVARRLSQTGG